MVSERRKSVVNIVFFRSYLSDIKQVWNGGIRKRALITREDVFVDLFFSLYKNVDGIKKEKNCVILVTDD